MSLNKLTTSTDYLQKQFLNIGCNDIKCTTLEVAGEPVGISNEYFPTMTAVTPIDMTFTTATAFYNTIGNHMNLDCAFFNITLPTGSSSITFEFTLPTGYLGDGTQVSFVGSTVDGVGNEFRANFAQHTVDNQRIRIVMFASSVVSGLFAISFHTTFKVIKQ